MLFDKTNIKIFVFFVLRPAIFALFKEIKIKINLYLVLRTIKKTLFDINKKVSEKMETTVKRFRKYVSLTGVAMQTLAKKTDLNWLTIRKVLKENGNISTITVMKLNNFLDSIKQEIEKV